MDFLNDFSGVLVAGSVVVVVAWLLARIESLRYDIKSDMRHIKDGLKSDMKHLEGNLMSDIKRSEERLKGDMNLLEERLTKSIERSKLTQK